MAEHASGSRDVSKDMTRGDSKARRSSLAKDTGQSLTDLAQQKEFTKPTYLLEVHIDLYLNAFLCDVTGAIGKKSLWYSSMTASDFAAIAM